MHTRHMPYRGLIVLAALSLAAPASALTFMKQAFECPIGGERFEQTTPSSGTSFGSEFDARPFGPISSPWRLPQCPGNGMIIYDPDLDAASVRKLTPFVLGKQYQQWRTTETPYFLVAQMMQFLDAPVANQAWVMLQASWEASPAQYPRYAGRALALYEQTCPDAAPGPGPWQFCQMIRGELERRLGRMDAARVRFQRLGPQLRAQPLDEADEQQMRLDVVAEQLRLIEAGNRRPARLPDKDR